MPVIVVPVTDVPESSAQPRKPPTGTQNSPNQPVSYNSNVAARANQENGRSPAEKRIPKAARFRRINEGGDAPEAHLPPHDSAATAKATYCAFCRCAV